MAIKPKETVFVFQAERSHSHIMLVTVLVTSSGGPCNCFVCGSLAQPLWAELFRTLTVLFRGKETRRRSCKESIKVTFVRGECMPFAVPVFKGNK
jgi:hypothetical protein